MMNRDFEWNNLSDNGGIPRGVSLCGIAVSDHSGLVHVESVGSDGRIYETDCTVNPASNFGLTCNLPWTPVPAPVDNPPLRRGTVPDAAPDHRREDTK
ncbi:hypothetical protein ACIRBY_13635 [Streptomyces sp. NPDC096136]|uniref:hypothetical protein n=1 Tax=Streptomyces sp. NPDC096136 TaxID=3366076 RepID=UPI0037FF29B6